MINQEHEAMREEARDAIIKELKGGYNGRYADLHNAIFNTGYYYSDSLGAREALGLYDVFEALDVVQAYENDHFGRITTDLSSPTSLINVLYYIIGEEVLVELMEGVEVFHDNSNKRATDAMNAEILANIAANDGEPEIIQCKTCGKYVDTRETPAFLYDEDAEEGFCSKECADKGNKDE